MPVVGGGGKALRHDQLEPHSLALGLKAAFSNELIELTVGEGTGEADDLVLLHVARQCREARHIRLEAEVAVGLSIQPVRPRNTVDPNRVGDRPQRHPFVQESKVLVIAHEEA